MTADDLRPGLRHARTLIVTPDLSVRAAAPAFGGGDDMPPVLATANLIALVEWTCVAALAPYIEAHQRTLGTRIEISHSAPTPIGMKVTAEVELIAIRGRRLRFKVGCRDETEAIGEGFHERAIIDHDRFMDRLARKR